MNYQMLAGFTLALCALNIISMISNAINARRIAKETRWCLEFVKAKKSLLENTLDVMPRQLCNPSFDNASELINAAEQALSGHHYDKCTSAIIGAFGNLITAAWYWVLETQKQQIIANSENATAKQSE